MGPIREHLGVSLRILFSPCPCVACERPIPEHRPPLGLCVTCRGRLRPILDQCDQCGLPLEAASLPIGFRCADCRRDPPAFDHLYSLYRYLPPLDQVVHHLKYGGLSFLGRQAAELMAAALYPHFGDIDLVVPIPLHWRRRIRRGYNQARTISIPLADYLGVPEASVLRRTRATRPQVGLPRSERAENPNAAFVARHRSLFEARRVLLVDDVVTTGATVSEAARTLARAGAASVTVAALARTPTPGTDDPSSWQDS